MRGVDLRALIVDLDRLYKMNQAKRASRLQRMRYWVHRLGGWMPMEKHRLIERPDTHVICHPTDHRIMLSGTTRSQSITVIHGGVSLLPVLHAAHEYRVLARGASRPLNPPLATGLMVH